MSNTRIDGYQLFCLIVLFLFGTTIFLDIGSGAKQDAWIVTFISPFAGLILFTIYFQLHKSFPTLPLTEYVRKIWGKYFGSIVSYFYIIYLIYIAARVLRDIEEILINSAYYKTSLMVVGICMMFVLIYTVNFGFEVFARVACICFFLIALTLLTLNIMFLITDLIHIENIRPILSEGWKPVVKELPLSITVPYGELITFSMIYPYLDKQTKIFKTGMMAVLFAGIYLTLNILLLICILGTDILARSSFPALKAASFIDIAGFIQRLDSFVIILVVFLGFTKVSMFFFCAVIGMNSLFKIKSSALSTYSIGVVIFLSSIMIAPSYQNHLDEGLEIVPYMLHIPLQIVIPLLLLLTVLIKRKVKNVMN